MSSIFYKNIHFYYPILEDKPIENIRPLTIKNRDTENYGKFDSGNYRTIPLNKQYPKSVIEISNANKTQIYHPTQKPIKLMKYLLQTYSKIGDLIIDNAMGSGTTLVAAKELGRKAIGIEIEEKYCEIAVDRLRQGVFTFN